MNLLILYIHTIFTNLVEIRLQKTFSALYLQPVLVTSMIKGT